MAKKKDGKLDRRNMLKGTGIAAMAATTGALGAKSASAAPTTEDDAKNPYGGGPGTGVSLPN